MVRLHGTPQQGREEMTKSFVERLLESGYSKEETARIMCLTLDELEKYLPTKPRRDGLPSGV